ncbi:hypothetical protein FUAX_56030 (plasmid) [Fulvitalea axinellae]|uniref:ASCH domain-containing protein n=1 Tax=Fulvitalea axinellae TaxID=1182444 RepID=A0AAU9CVS5_9BACT|nr:hypothetical protein FUAX_56030 [Fulvitalea axinellae]
MNNIRPITFAEVRGRRALDRAGKSDKGAVLISIRPEYVRRIFSGKKRYEFRKKDCGRGVTEFFVYETAPRSAVIGKFRSLVRLSGSPEFVWELTKDFAGIGKDEFFRYFEGCETAWAFRIEGAERFRRPRPLSDFGVSWPPQNFQYVDFPEVSK